MKLLLKGLKWFDGNDWIHGDIRIRDNIFSEIATALEPQSRELVLHYEDHYIYPGLINSHDHLEMNLYPKLGSPPYNNYVEWAKDIYNPDKTPVKEIQRVSIEDRLLWGGVKNLISGVTTVVHHNPWHRSLNKKQFPVRVLKDFAWSHSLAFANNIQSEFPRGKNIPYIIHAAEGTDAIAKEEIAKLKALGLLKSNTVLVHGVALGAEDATLIKQAGASLIWCPASNFYMFNTTCRIDAISDDTKIALGSDSTLTGSATLIDELKIALATEKATRQQLFEMVTTTPARIFNLSTPAIKVYGLADFFIAPAKEKNYYDNLFKTQPSDINAVTVNGEIRLSENPHAFLKHEIRIDGKLKFTDVNVGSLKKSILKKVDAEVLDKNPLWTLIT